MKLRRLAAIVAAMALTLGTAGAVFADSGNPQGIDAQVSGHTVTITADWTWTKCNGSKIVGWAVAWGDPDFQQNPVPDGSGGFYYMGDSVQGNQVFTDGVPCTGTSGPLGSLSHTYADAGVKNICVIVYDMLKNQDGSFPSSGAHGDKAGGDDRNTDNSVEQNELKGESICLSPEIPVEVPKTASIHVTKLPLNQTVTAANPNATFHYAVTANGDVPLTDVTLGDDKCPGVTATGGDTNDDQILDTDEIWTYDCTVAVFETQTNTATATGHYGDTTVTDHAQADTIVTTQFSASPSPILTAPPTDSINGPTNDAGGTLPLMLIVLGVIGLGAVVLTPSRKKR